MNGAVRAPAACALTRDTLLVHARKLPAAAQVMAGLCELLEDANTDLDHIAAQIRLEPSLAARVIRTSNSPVFGGGQRVGSVDEAVNRVGFGEVLRLVGAATVAGLVDRALGFYAITAERLRESMLFHALASEAVAARTDINPKEAYSAGLLRAIGILVIDRAARMQLTVADAYDQKHHATYSDWEVQKFGLTSVDVTTMVLDEWRFPPNVVAGLQEHLLRSESGYDDRLAVVLNLGGSIVHLKGYSLPGDAAHWTPTPEKLAAAGLDEEQYNHAIDEATAVFERQRSALF